MKDTETVTLDEILNCQYCDGKGYFYWDEEPHEKQDPCFCVAQKAAIIKLFEQTVESAKPVIKKHICRFNDGDCVCDCYVEGVEKYEHNLKELLK